MESFFGQLDWSTGLQLLVDLVLVVLIAGLLFSRHRGRPDAELRSLIGTFDDILSETKSLADEFERNIQERAQLIQHILELLDERLKHAQTTIARLEAESQQAGPSPPPPSKHKTTASILQLARSGMSAQEIALATQRPIGEVELILSLEQLSRPKSK